MCDLQEDASWQTVLRALCAVEAVLQQGSTAACGEVAVHFQASHPILMQSTRKVLELLDGMPQF